MSGSGADEGRSAFMEFTASRKRRVIFIVVVALMTAIVSIGVLGVGGVIVPFDDVLKSLFHPLFPQFVPEASESYYPVIIEGYRAPRVIMGILTGACLAVAGASMQSILKNPLADPFTLGLSSAASCGAGIAIAFGPAILGSTYYYGLTIWGNYVTVGWFFTIVMAFGFGLASTAILLYLTKGSAVSRSTMILTGVVIGYLFSAVLSYLKYVSEESTLKDITNWLLGGMWGSTWSSVILVLPIAILGMILLESYAFELNTLSCGDDVAKNLGVDVRRLRVKILVICALITSSCMAFTGIIGFIGLMSPHIVRMLIGNDNRYLIPASAFLGALILVSCDAVARYIVRPDDLPVGIIMYVLGGIFFVFLIKKMRGGYEI